MTFLSYLFMAMLASYGLFQLILLLVENL